MPINRLALIRYKTIDNCLRNPYRKWTIHMLVDACSEALYEYEGKQQSVSLRTVQADIQNMRSEKMGYNAPIVVVDKKYYIYEDPDYSITNMPLTPTDVDTLQQITQTLLQFEGFPQFADMAEVLKKVENKVFAIKNTTRSIIDFDKNNDLKGIQFLNEIYDAIKKKECLKIIYRTFTATKPIIIHLSPYLLKEYRNRWFVFGFRKHAKRIAPLPLDRILRIRKSDEDYIENTMFDSETYFKDIIGVTLHENIAIEKIIFWVEKSNAPYVTTKPFHHSQKQISKDAGGTVFSIEVIPNFELERELIGYGEFLKVLEPFDFQQKIALRIKKMHELY